MVTLGDPAESNSSLCGFKPQTPHLREKWGRLGLRTPGSAPARGWHACLRGSHRVQREINGGSPAAEREAAGPTAQGWRPTRAGAAPPPGTAPELRGLVLSGAPWGCESAIQTRPAFQPPSQHNRIRKRKEKKVLVSLGFFLRPTHLELTEEGTEMLGADKKGGDARPPRPTAPRAPAPGRSAGRVLRGFRASGGSRGVTPAAGYRTLRGRHPANKLISISAAERGHPRQAS